MCYNERVSVLSLTRGEKAMKKILVFLLTLVLVVGLMPGAAFAADNGEVTSQRIESVSMQASAASNGLTSIKVKWNKVEGASGYCVYRALSKNGKWSLVKTVTGEDTVSYVDTGRTTGKTYYYKVRAYVKEAGAKRYSKYSAITSAYSRPVKVKNLVAVNKGIGSSIDFTLNWDKVSGASGYELRVRTSSSRNSTWKSYYLMDDKVKSYPLNASNYKAITNGTVSNKVVWAIDPGDSFIEFKVRAYKTVNGKKVYGMYSDVCRLEPILTPEKLQAAVHEYVRDKYPDYYYQDTRADGDPMTEKNSSWGVTWSNYYVNQYNDVANIMKWLGPELDYYFGKMFSDGPCGFFYMKKTDIGMWQCWWLN